MCPPNTEYPPSPQDALAALRERVARATAPVDLEPRSVQRSRTRGLRRRASAARAPNVPAATVAAIAPAPQAASFGVVEQRESPVPTRAAGAQRNLRGRGWLGEGLSALARVDPAVAGGAVLELLTMQGTLRPIPVSYDLIVSSSVGDTVDAWAVTVSERGTHVMPTALLRSLSEAAHVHADLAALGELTLGGRRRRNAIVVEGNDRRSALTAVCAVADAPISLRDLDVAGVTLHPATVLRLVCAAVAADWTIGHRFTIAFEIDDGDATRRLMIGLNDGSALSLSGGLPYNVPSATVRCTPAALSAILTGARPPRGERASIAGAQAPLVLLQAWVARLESGR